ncbi:MAG: NUDIX hydrolase N-terminal domain-containing protein [Promethearchaeota archaeon]
MKLNNQIVLWADELRDISASGLQFSSDMYNRERYQKVQDIAIRMLAFATNKLVNQLEPLRTTIFTRPSPLVGGDAAVITDTGQILLVQRADNRKWAMPGGLLEVGETPVEGVIREVFEETGIHCHAVALIGVFDSRLCGTTYSQHLYQLTFLCEPLKEEEVFTPTYKHETVNIGWFNEASLPLDIDPGHISRIPVAFRVWRGEAKAFFDE